MADATDENPFGQELADAFAADEAAENPVAPVEEPKKDDDTTPPAPDAPKVEEPKKDDPANPEDPNKKEDPAATPTDPAKDPKDDTTPPTDPKAPTETEEPVAPQPLTRDDLTEIVKKIQTDERVSGQDIEVATNEVMEAYYPDGLSNVLVDQSSGKELKTPADVVAASNGTMEMEEAAQWLLNEQYKLDQNIAKIKSDAGKIAETTISFKRDSIAALEKYEPLFKAYPQLQSKIFDKMMKQVKADTTKNVILSAPDVMEYYDDYLEPYQQAYEQSTKQSATNPVAPVTPPPITPGADDRLDEGGDGGATTEVDDPNDFAQQVSKELSKGL
jgi:hypothetical protein